MCIRDRGLTDKVAKKEQAAKVGEMIAKKAQEAGITTVVFDRNGCLLYTSEGYALLKEFGLPFKNAKKD